MTVLSLSVVLRKDPRFVSEIVPTSVVLKREKKKREKSGRRKRLALYTRMLVQSDSRVTSVRFA